MLGSVVVLAAVVLILQGGSGPAPVVRGADAPDFSLPLWTGSAADDRANPSLGLSDLRGRVVLVNFWATWCEPCEREMPAMERLYASLPRDSFELLAVAIDEDPSDVAEFLGRYDLSFPVVLDMDQTVYRSYQTMGVPESLLLDANGRIVERYVGPREWDAPEYEQRILSLVAP